MISFKQVLTCLFFVFLATTSFSQQKQMLGSFIADIEDVHVLSILPDENPSTTLAVVPYAWTQSGVENIARPFIRFDLSSLPDGAKIEEALLVYYYDPFSITAQSDHSSDNGFFIRRVTGAWDEFGIKWNNQPPTTTVNQVYVPPAVYSRQNYVINVTELIKDILADSVTGNQGVRLHLEKEAPFRVVVVASSKHPDISRHPQLWINYSDGLVGTSDDEPEFQASIFKVYPNPSSGQFTISSDQVPHGKFSARLYNLEGKLVLEQALAGSFSFVYANSLPPGTYVLKISSDAGYEQEEKIVLIK